MHLSFLIFLLKMLLINIFKSGIGLENYKFISIKNDKTAIVVVIVKEGPDFW